MSPLMWSKVSRPAVFVADLAALQPAVQRLPVGGRADRFGAVEVRRGPGKQEGAFGPAAPGAGLLFGDVAFEFGVDGDQCLASHFVVVVPQVGGAVGVADDAVVG